MQERKRHIFLTLWLIVVIAANSFEAFRQVYLREIMIEEFPGAPEWVFAGLSVIAVLNIIFGVALFMWKKWAFWGYLLSSVIAVLLYLQLGVGVQALGSLAGVAILYVALQVGGEHKGWHQLE